MKANPGMTQDRPLLQSLDLAGFRRLFRPAQSTAASKLYNVLESIAFLFFRTEGRDHSGRVAAHG
ncbi:hypothetical protein ACQR1I_16985 [Bradyrhizobium sp. HKCCYLS2038]|uniref:hypothetical protein n=1 Tax=unclassified Bradyrhizobium TaxID=2631580 RepID=UPI003EB81566